jgi:hypothetical protein
MYPDTKMEGVRSRGKRCGEYGENTFDAEKRGGAEAAEVTGVHRGLTAPRARGLAGLLKI